MKIKRYFAKDVKTAIQMVRDEQGPDAVIMSNNKVDNGVEIIAAIDYDENIFTNQPEKPKSSQSSRPYPSDDTVNSEEYTDTAPEIYANTRSTSNQSDDIKELKSQINSVREILEGQMASFAWSDLGLKCPVHAHVIKKLVSIGFSEELSSKLASKLPYDGDDKYIWRHVLAELVKYVPIQKKNILTSGGIVALVGPTGVGKTTTAAKLAATYALKHGKRKVGLITIDNYRVAAYEQMKVYGKIIDIPVRMAETSSDLSSILNDYYDKELIIIDTAGMGQYDKHNTDQAAILDQDRFNVKKTLVISATTQYRAINDIIRSFDCYSPSECIITKMDESPTQGHIIDAICKHNIPVSFITDGQEVPEDIHPAIAHNLISRCVATGLRETELPSDLMIAMNYGEATANASV